MAKRYYTSKIAKFEDLDDVRSFGFRGEALNSIASLAQSFSIATKTDSDEVAVCYEIDHSGEIISSKSICGTTGTTVVVNRLFQKLPVRRQEALRTGKNNFKAVKEMLEAYALCLPSIRFSLKHVPENQGAKNTKTQFASWMKAKADNVMSAARLLFGNHLISQLQYLEYSIPNSENTASQDNITFEFCLPKKNSDPTALEKIDKQYYFINNRPIIPIKSIATLIKKAYQSLCGSEVRKLPFVYFNLTVKKGYDVNWEPSKNDVRIDRLHDVEEAVKKAIEDIWEISINSDTDVHCDELSQIESQNDEVAIASSIITRSEADELAKFSPDTSDNSIQENSPTPLKSTNEEPTCATSINLNHPKESLLEWSKGYHPIFRSPVKVLQSTENLEKASDFTPSGVSIPTAVSEITPTSPKQLLFGSSSPLTNGQSGRSTSATDESHGKEWNAFSVFLF
ncbi:hypothetical protein BKA69DRAFT_118083 [Paraphysoderma sedebokerense]|nr:hypothetical protein BKA69DRAFT_118083 [Paraphysoderma sedebokerense]